MKKLLLVIILLIPALAGGQTALIKHLSTEDTEQATTTWKELKLAEKKWAEVQRKIDSKYFSKTESKWNFEFTEDFKAIVPSRNPHTLTVPDTYFRYSPGTVLTPGTGSIIFTN